MTALLTSSGLLLALVIGIACGRAYSLREVREAKAELLRCLYARNVLSSGIRSRAEQAAGMVP